MLNNITTLATSLRQHLPFPPPTIRTMILHLIIVIMLLLSLVQVLAWGASLRFI